MVAVVLGAAAGLVAGRRPLQVSATHIGRPNVILLAAGLAAAGCSRLPVGGAAPGLAVAGYALLGMLALRLRHRPGMVLVAAGLLSNLAVILADAGMPVATMDPGTVSGLHHGLSRADHLSALSDVIAVPILRLTASPGDLVLSVGAAVAAFTWLTTPRPPAGPQQPGAERAPVVQ